MGNPDLWTTAHPLVTAVVGAVNAEKFGPVIALRELVVTARWQEQKRKGPR